MLLLDLTHTSRTRARTGIQRVARALRENLADQVMPIVQDPVINAWRQLESWEVANLRDNRTSGQRHSLERATAKWRSRMRRLLGRSTAHGLRGEFEGFIEPELFSARIGREFSNLFRHIRGPRVALVHDVIPLRFPNLTPHSTVARFPSYLQELLQFDGIAVMSDESRDSLTGYWRWLEARNPPPLFVLPLGVDAPLCFPTSDERERTTPVVLSVGTLEGRKNHLALLEACEQLWSRGVKFNLRLIGHVNAETGGAALARLRALQAAGRPLRYDGPTTDDEVDRAYAECACTVYPSIAEGFGLPVIESLCRGKACICSGRGALGEISRHGGCVALDEVNRENLAAAIARLLGSPGELSTLAAAARARTFKSWANYTAELTTWMRTLPRR
jgi:glycosyltransferase involved in cell wall biosynthesis